jgi:hypothetical protein
MIALEVQHELGRLNTALREYSRQSHKTTLEVLVKQAAKLSFALRTRFRTLTPPKGEIRSTRLVGLRAGQGVHVRPRVLQSIMAKYGAKSSLDTGRLLLGRRGAATVRSKGKRLNITALAIQRELSLRESGRGFLAYASGIRAERLGGARGIVSWWGRYAQLLGTVSLMPGVSTDEVTFRWGQSPASSEAAGAMRKPRAAPQLAGAIRDIRLDMEEYLARKQREAIERQLHVR